MTTISITPEDIESGDPKYLAVAGSLHSSGKTPGEALDALTAQLDESENGTLVIVQKMRPDRFFTAEQQARLGELMDRWRSARDSQSSLPPDDQAELEDLVQAELDATAKRAESMIRQLIP